MLYDDNKDTKLPPLGAGFWACKTPTQKFQKFSQTYALAHRFTSVATKMAKINEELSVRKGTLLS